MKKKWYDDFLRDRFDLVISKDTQSEIIEGSLVDRQSRSIYQITNSIPRFVNDANNYASSFGFQWNVYKTSQLDSFTKLRLTHDRFYQNTKWKKDELVGKMILEVGSGAGRFTEVLLETGAMVFSFDYSAAVDANFSVNGNHNNLFLFQGDLLNVPFPDNYFDFVLCYGVLQHTPDPVESFNKIYLKLKPGGKLSIDYYAKLDEPTVWSTPKYFWRPLTTKMNHRLLLALIKVYIFLWLPFDTMIKSLPRNWGYRFLSRIPIPCYNYLGSRLTYSQRLEWAILDTFDALSAKFDQPKTKEEFNEMVSTVKSSSLDVFRGGTGFVANLIKS